MAENKKTSYNGIVVLDKPLFPDEEHPIYGVLFNIKEDFQHLVKGSGCIIEYVNYVAGLERFIKNGGKISPDGKEWILPDGEHSFPNNPSFCRFVSHLTKGTVNVSQYGFNDFIEVKEGETCEYNTRLVISKDLINRYTQYTTKQ